MTTTNNNKPIKQYKADIINDILELNPNIKGIKEDQLNTVFSIKVIAFHPPAAVC